LIAQRYSFPSLVPCSVKSVSHSWFGAEAVKSRLIRSSWAAAPAQDLVLLLEGLDPPLGDSQLHRIARRPPGALAVLDVGLLQPPVQGREVDAEVLRDLLQIDVRTPVASDPDYVG
jgi:hypothetical protein